jgi:putative spermidine/putrescine transport system ATP-binding protein
MDSDRTMPNSAHHLQGSLQPPDRALSAAGRQSVEGISAPDPTTGLPRGATSRSDLSLEHVTRRYGPVVAVDDVSLRIPQGEFLTLLGPSGSGKTTLLMMVAGFVAPSAGEFFLGEQSITHLPPDKRNFGMVFQGYALFPHMTVADNIAFALKVRRRPRAEIEEKVGRAIDLVQLGGLADRLPRQLSGGQQQRVALARALVFTPHILLLDEPLGALDRKLRAEVQVELKQLHQRIGTTFIYVTHDQEEALSMSDRVAIIRDGRLVQLGSPEDLYERPASRFVAGFLGESNFLRGQVSEVHGDSFTYEVGERPFRQMAADRRPAVGETVLIALRPEKIAIASEPGEVDDNSLVGEIVAWNYYGSTIHFTVRTAALGLLAVSASTWRNRVEPSQVADVHLSWPATAGTTVAED